MPRKRMSVRKIKEILRLHFEEKRSNREIGLSVGKSPSVVCDCMSRFRGSGLLWPQSASLCEEDFEQHLYPSSQTRRKPDYVIPDFEYMHKELAGKHVTLSLLWQEYRVANGESSYQYSQFCELYRRWAKPLGAVMRHSHKAGEKTFIDWSGDGVEIVDRTTGEVWEAQLFVATLGASSYTFARAAPSREMPHWLRLHDEAFEYFKGVSAVVVPDNEKTGVTSASLYEPDLNRTYAAWAEHMSVAVIPTRPRKPRDKAKVESAVLIAQRWILARLRNHTFFSVDEANMEIARLLKEYNDKPMQKLGVSRRHLYETVDRPCLRPLPSRRFEPFEWREVKLNIDYHVQVDKTYYSAPYKLIGQKVEVRATGSTIEILYKGRRVASHTRCYGHNWQYITEHTHRPEHHKAFLDWTPERLINWARKCGEKTASLVDAVIASKKHPEQGYRSCLGVMRLGQKYGADRLEAACERALELRSPSYKTVNSILKTGADRLPPPNKRQSSEKQLTLPRHENIRGSEYYH